MNLDALLLSFRLAAVVSAILLLLALPLAYWLAFTRWRGKFLLESVVALPLVLPPTVLGFYALIALGPRGPLGRLWQFLFGHTLAFTFAGLVIASLVYSLPFAVQPLVAGFAAVQTNLVDAARLLGAGSVRIVFSLLVPLARRSLMAAAVLSFLHTVGEFGVVLMLGGDIPGATRTLSIVLYNQVESFNYAAATRTAAILLGLSVVALAVLYSKGEKRGSAGRRA